MKTIIITIGMAAIFSFGCRSVDKMIDQGDFDTALLKAIRKIRDKHPLKEKYVLAIEDAFKKATDKDVHLIERWHDSPRANDWYSIIEKIKKIESRQNTITSFLPLQSQDGYRATFAFVKTEGIRENAIEKFQKLTYQEGLKLLENARSGHKSDARLAYATFSRLWEFDPDYLDARTLWKEAETLGINHVQVRIEDATFFRIPTSILHETVIHNFENEKWTRYYFEDEIQSPDYEIKVVINHLDIGPERIQESTFIDTKEIKDGFEYVLDAKGNVLKDSLGNDVKKPLIKQISARVIETHQFKSGVVSGFILTKNLLTGRVNQISFNSDLIFEHFFARYRGDFRALNPESKRLLGISPVAFPSDQQMVYDLLSDLKPIIGEKVKNLNLPV